MKHIDIKENGLTEKLIWETPKLICLDKGKTEGGSNISSKEDTASGTLS